MNMIRTLLFYTLASIAFLLNGCSSAGAYQQEGKKNLLVNVKADSSTYLEVYELDGPCDQKMKGEVKLHNGINKFALANNKHYYLRINFKTVSLLSGSQNITLGAYVTPQSNYTYLIDALYEDDMYDIEIKKRNIHSHKVTNMTVKPLESCKEKEGRPFISIDWLPTLNKSVEVL